MNKVQFYMIPYCQRTYSVYAHVNKLNGKIYFGLTKGYPKNRWGAGSGYVNCTKFYTSIQKYGWNGFFHIIINKGLSEEEAAFYEKSYIKIYNTTDRNFGYNTDEGGKLSSVSGETKRKLIKEKRMKPIICLETGMIYESQQSLANIEGKSHSYVHHACKSKGSRTHNKKHYLYLEYFKTLSREQIQDIIDGKLQNHKEVVCMETGEVFWDATKAGQTLSYGKFSVANRCNHFRDRGKDNFAGGFHWAYKEDYDKLTKEDVERVINLDNFKVVCIETGEVYDNPIKAAKATGAYEGVIRGCCRGKFRFANNLHWMYEREYKKATKEDIEKLFTKSRKKIESRRIKKVICLETEQVFDNMKDAAKVTGASSINISKSCKCSGGSTFTSGGYHWMFKEDYDIVTSEEIHRRLSNNPRIRACRRKQVRCVETGKIFECISDALMFLGVKGSTSSISKCCKNSDLTYKGFHWEFVTSEFDTPHLK